MKISSEKDKGTQIELRFLRTDGGEYGDAESLLDRGRAIC